MLPPPIPTPLPILKRNLFRPPPLRFQHFIHIFLPLRFTYHITARLHPILIFHVFTSSLSPTSSTSCVIMSCHLVIRMSVCHVNQSCHYVCVILSYTYVILSRVNLSWHLVISHSLSLCVHICELVYICEYWSVG